MTSYSVKSEIQPVAYFSQSSKIKLAGTNCVIQPHVSLSDYTSYRIGGEAQWFVTPKNNDEVEATFEWYLKQDLPLTFLGAGSNLLVSDSGIDGLVVNTRHLRYKRFVEDEGLITVGAGEPLARIAWLAAKKGWQGLEWAVGIPGLIGGSVVMNAGAHGRSVSDILVSATVLSPNSGLQTLSCDELEYSYRTSKLQGDRLMVIEATFQLQPGGNKQEVMAQTTHNLQQRKNSQPYHLPSCGSVFRNPLPQYAGSLIEQLGLKGYQIGGAQIAHRHANFILNCGNAKAMDIFNLINYIQEQVQYHWSISLEPEVKFLGQF
jgi:UDP-N-acetylmuramate dehydrogenase